MSIEWYRQALANGPTCPPIGYSNWKECTDVYRGIIEANNLNCDNSGYNKDRHDRQACGNRIMDLEIEGRLVFPNQKSAAHHATASSLQSPDSASSSTPSLVPSLPTRAAMATNAPTHAAMATHAPGHAAMATNAPTHAAMATNAPTHAAMATHAPGHAAMTTHAPSYPPSYQAMAYSYENVVADSIHKVASDRMVRIAVAAAVIAIVLYKMRS